MNPLRLHEIGKTGLQVTRLGIGGGPVGQLEPDLSDRRGVAAIRRALASGIRYFDTSPYYGRGRSEMRFGRALADVPRDSYVISTKVGRLLKLNGTQEVDFDRISLVNLPALTPVYDFSRSAILRSFEQSLQRLGLESVDILFLHDVPEGHYQQAIEQASPTLAELRSQGVVTAIGAGMGNLDLLIRFAEEADFDCFLLPSRYTLMDQTALAEFLPLCRQKGISIIMGAPYDGGRIFGRARTTAEFAERLDRIRTVCKRHNVPIKAAALQFAAAHPAAVSVIPGPRTAEEVKDNIRMMAHPIPSELWDDLRDEKLVHPESPTP
jgi:D-threo-aldose 1-dehydrogenase